MSPIPWEAREHPVNAFVNGIAEQLSQRGHRVLILAPSRSGERVRAFRRELSAMREDPQRLLHGTNEGRPRVVLIGEALEVPGGGHTRMRPPSALPVDVSRTAEHLLSSVPLDFVHVHEPFAPSASNAALRHSRSLNVATFHRPTERLLSTLIARRFVETFFGRLDARTATDPDTAALMDRYFPGRYTLLCRQEVSKAADELEAVYRRVASRRHEDRSDERIRRALAARRLIDVDLHSHTDHSSDCATPVEVLLATARERGLGAIAITDHNEISGALEARSKASACGVEVIVGEEVKTASEGEVIGLFIEERIERGMTLRETIAEIKRQGGVVYIPHPFDRMHAVPDYEHLLPVISEIDAIEVYNPRVAIGAFNEEAMRFAAKYRILAGAGSDSHVAQGLGSVRIAMREFCGAQEFLQSLRDAEISTKPTSLLYVQALKFLQTKATPPSARRASRARRVRRATGARRGR